MTKQHEALTATNTQQYLTFVLNAELFGIEISGVREIIEYGRITAVPMMPSFVRGVINLRGAVVPVIDLSLRFNKSASPVTRKTCIVILETGEDDRQIMGVVVDAVSAVLEIADDQVGPAPSFGANVRPDFIYGMGRLDERFVILLNVKNVLSLDEMTQLSQSAMESDDVASIG